MINIIGHRGAISYTPENTLSSIKSIKNINNKWIEIDVILSKDNIPIIFHDEKLDRCTNLKGNVYDYTLNELKKGDIYYNGINEKIPTLLEFINCCNNLYVNILLEVKNYNDNDILVSKITEILKNIENYKIDIIICSYNRNIIKLFKNILPNYKRSLIVDKIPNDWEEFIKSNYCYSLNLNPKLNDLKLIKYCISKINCYFHVINDINEFINLYNLDIKGIITDYPEKLININKK